MKQNTLLKETVDTIVYESPDCEVFFVNAQKVICDSDTEHVDEEDGEW